MIMRGPALDLDAVHHTRQSAIAVESWERLEQYEFSSPALVDTDYLIDDCNLLARIDFTQVLEYATQIEADLASYEELMLLRAKAPFVLKPYLGTPKAENALRHSIAHDRDVRRQLREMNWRRGAGAVYGAGKNWRRSRNGVLTPAGKSALVGWDRDGAGPGQALWQDDAVAHNRFHFDDGTTSILVRKLGIFSQVLIDPIREVVDVVKDAIDGGGP